MRLSAAERLELIDHEIAIGALILAEVLDRREAEEWQWTRLAQASARIGRARHV